MHTYTHAHTHTHMHTHTHTHAHTHMHTHARMHAHTHTHAHTRTHAHTHDLEAKLILGAVTVIAFSSHNQTRTRTAAQEGNTETQRYRETNAQTPRHPQLVLACTSSGG